MSQCVSVISHNPVQNHPSCHGTTNSAAFSCQTTSFSREHIQIFARMQVAHAANCLQGCLSSSLAHSGLIVRLSSPNIPGTGSPMTGDQLAVILRSPDGGSGA